MWSVIIKFLEFFGSLPGTFVLVGMVAAGVVDWYVAAAIDKPGLDRARVIRWLRRDGARVQYRWLLERGLNRLDRFLGDAGQPELSWPSPFGNRRPAEHPYWTGPALDRCALLAVIYPVASMIVVWLWQGDAGPAAELLGLKEGARFWPRMSVMSLIAALVIGSWRMAFNKIGIETVLWLFRIVIFLYLFR